MSIERLRALEKKWRDESVSGFDGDGNLSDTWTAQAMRSCADELATLIAELGQEVGAVGYDDGTGRVRDWASPAHTSEARDAARLDWLEKHGCWQFAGPSESDIRGPAYRWFDYDTDGHDYSATLREAIDAAIAAEAK